MSREVSWQKQETLFVVRTQAVATFTQPLPASWRRRCTAQLLEQIQAAQRRMGALSVCVCLLMGQ